MEIEHWPKMVYSLIVPPLIFGFFVGPLPLSCLDPPLTIFLDFILQIFQRMLKRIALFTKL